MSGLSKFKEILLYPFKGWSLDKWAHLGIGGLSCALMTIMFIFCEFQEVSWRMLSYTIPGFIVVLFFSFFKELIDSTGFDWKDIFAAILGCILVEFSVLFGIILYFLGH